MWLATVYLEYVYIQCLCITLSQVAVGQTDSVCFVLEPPQMIKGDVMVRRLSVSYKHTHSMCKGLAILVRAKCPHLYREILWWWQPTSEDILVSALILWKLHTVSSSFLLSLQIACYHKNIPVRTHETVFRVQFHTGALSGDQLSLQKEDLDHANKGTQSVFGKNHLSQKWHKIIWR